MWTHVIHMWTDLFHTWTVWFMKSLYLFASFACIHNLTWVIYISCGVHPVLFIRSHVSCNHIWISHDITACGSSDVTWESHVLCMITCDINTCDGFNFTCDSHVPFVKLFAEGMSCISFIHIKCELGCPNWNIFDCNMDVKFYCKLPCCVNGIRPFEIEKIMLILLYSFSGEFIKQRITKRN